MVENQPHHFAPTWHEAINFIADCDEVALKNATSYFFEKPIDKIRPLCYTFAKEVQVLLLLIEFCKASMKRMNEEKLNQMAEFIHHYIRENNGESPKFKDMHRDTITNPKFYDPEIRAYDDPDEQMILRA